MVEKQKAKVENTEKKSTKKCYIIFQEQELEKFGIGKTPRPRDVGNLIRKKFGLPELATIRSSKKRELVEALDLNSDATQAEINQAMLEKLK